MASKFVIAQKPTFKKEVPIPQVGSDPIKVPFVFKVKARKDLAEMFDGWNEDNKKIFESEGETLKELTELEIDIQAAQVADIVESWGFSEELNEENIKALLGTHIDVFSSISETYQEAYKSARSGN